MQYSALQSWRGLCACMVIIYHFDPYSHIYRADFFRHAYLFVDFFFVLSGFIIFEAYFSRLAQGFSFGKFIAMRIGRLYPMHIVTLMLVMVYLTVRGALEPADGSIPPPAHAGLIDNLSTLTQVTLLNAMGLRGDLSWNLPSWSIGAEFYTYPVFALAIIWLRGSVSGFAVVVAIMALAILVASGNDTINLTYDFGYIRCLCGFALGALLSRIRPAGGYFGSRPEWQATVAEVSVLIIVIGFVWGAGSSRLSFLAPVVFTFAVGVFADEHGLIGRWMRNRILVWIGERSYSIYMMQFICIVAMMDLVWLTDQMAGTGMRAMLTTGATGNLWFGDLVTALMVAIIIAVSALTYRYIEQPGRARMRRALATGTAPHPGHSDAPPLNGPVSK